MSNKFQNPYTKEDIKYVIENWGKIEPSEIATYLKRPKNSLSYLGKAIRDAGYPLPKQSKKAALKFVISEALAELGLGTGKGK